MKLKKHDHVSRSYRGGYAVVSPSEGEIVAKKFYEMGYQTASAKPNAVILSYPVITSGDCAHRGSFTALLGADASERKNWNICLWKNK